jgi:hypothetical protein
MNTSVCDEVLENIKLSLLQCKNNNTTYNLESPINLRTCENITNYESSLYATKTRIIMKTPDIITKYSINYKVKDRIVEIYES